VEAAVPDVAGVHVASAAQVAPLVEQQLKGRGEWSDRDDHAPVDGMTRAVRAAGSLAPVFAHALVGLLEHDDPAVRAGAAFSLVEASDHVDADRIVEILDARPERFRGVRPPVGYPAADVDLEACLLLVIAKAARLSDDRARRYLMRCARAGAVSAVLALARLDPEWVVANAEAVVPRRAIGGVLRAVAGRDHRRAIVNALTPWPPDVGSALLASTSWALLPLPADEIAELAALVRPKPGRNT
jgi:hypothetical protein